MSRKICTVYTVEYAKLGALKKITVGFWNLSQARSFAKRDYTGNVVVHNFSSISRACDYMRRCDWEF